MFFARDVWCIVDVSSVSPSSEQLWDCGEIELYRVGYLFQCADRESTIGWNLYKLIVKTTCMLKLCELKTVY